MEAVADGHTDLGVDHSCLHVPGSSILGEAQVSLCDASMKRDASQTEDQLCRKAQKKRRRSSLAAHRRSITGDVISTFHIDSESGSQASTDSGSQKSSSAESQSSPASDVHVSSLLPNPVNVHMDEIVTKMRRQIAALHEECHQWTNLLHNFEEAEECSSRQLAESVSLHMLDVPDDVQQLAISEYLTPPPLQLHSIRDRMDPALLQYRFDKEACLQDVTLIQETVQAIHKSNRYWSSHFSHTIAEDSSEVTAQPADLKQLIMNYLSCC